MSTKNSKSASVQSHPQGILNIKPKGFLGIELIDKNEFISQEVCWVIDLLCDPNLEDIAKITAMGDCGMVQKLLYHALGLGSQ